LLTAIREFAYVLMRILLMADNLDLVASQNEKYTFVIGASKGDFRFDEIKIWLTKHVSKKDA
jgi:death-on-curing protein